MNGAEANKHAQAKRFAEYSSLRDQGMLPVDAAREIGIGDDSGSRYERSYRRSRGLPIGESGGHEMRRGSLGPLG